jgi:hypothetical protein
MAEQVDRLGVAVRVGIGPVYMAAHVAPIRVGQKSIPGCGVAPGWAFWGRAAKFSGLFPCANSGQVRQWVERGQPRRYTQS